MSETSQPNIQEPSARALFVELPPNCRVNQRMIESLDTFFDFTHPAELKRDLTNVFLNYLMRDCDHLADDFKNVVENYIMLFDWLDIADDEMEERGFRRN